MGYRLRFVQRYQPSFRDEFLELERQFAELEQAVPDYPKGRRYLPCAGREPGNTLIWECEFQSMAALSSALDFLKNDERHERLYRQQVKYMEDAYTEIDELFH